MLIYIKCDMIFRPFRLTLKSLTWLAFVCNNIVSLLSNKNIPLNLFFFNLQPQKKED